MKIIRAFRERDGQRDGEILPSFFYYYNTPDVNLLYLVWFDMRSGVSLWPISYIKILSTTNTCVIHSLFPRIIVRGTGREKRDALLIKQWCVQTNLLALLTFFPLFLQLIFIRLISDCFTC